MLILAIESTAKAASAALCRDWEILAHSYQRTALTHSATLLPMIDDMLKNSGTDKTAIDAVAVAHGPGSFTGVRIGVATAKGLCWGLDRPAIGVSTLEAMAHLALFVPEGTVICPAMDARRSQIYNALFRMEGGKPARITPDRAIAAADLAAEAAELRSPLWVLGDGALVCAAALEERGVEYALAPEMHRWQNACGVALAAQDKTPVGAEDLLPVYLRLSQAERERQERMEAKPIQ